MATRRRSQGLGGIDTDVAEILRCPESGWRYRRVSPVELCCLDGRDDEPEAEVGDVASRRQRRPQPLCHR